MQSKNLLMSNVKKTKKNIVIILSTEGKTIAINFPTGFGWSEPFDNENKKSNFLSSQSSFLSIKTTKNISIPPG